VWAAVVLLFLLLPSFALASIGDSSPFHRRCITACQEKNCTLNDAFKENQPLSERLLGWSCEDECR